MRKTSASDPKLKGKGSAHKGSKQTSMSTAAKTGKRKSNSLTVDALDALNFHHNHVISDDDDLGADVPLISDSDSDADTEFLGFVPVQQKRRVDPEPAVPSTSDQAPQADQEAQTAQAAMPQATMVPPMTSMNMTAMPAQFPHFPQYPQYPMMPMYPNPYWGYMPPMNNAQQDQDEDVSEGSVEDGELSDDNQEVSLEEHIREAQDPDETGPPVSSKVADLATKLWNKPQDIRELYTKHKRPANVPCLQRINLDEELIDAIPNHRAKKLDFALKGLNNVFVHGAVVACELMQIAKQAQKGQDIRQQIVNTTAEVMKFMAHGAQQTSVLRKEQLKPVLNPLVKTKLCGRNTSFEEINSSHCLFGGDVQGIVKKGNKFACYFPHVTYMRSLGLISNFFMNHFIKCVLLSIAAKENKSLVTAFLGHKGRGYRSPLVPPFKSQQNRSYPNFQGQYPQGQFHQGQQPYPTGFNTQFRGRGRGNPRGRRPKSGGNYYPITITRATIRQHT